VSQPQRQRTVRGLGAGHDAARARTRHQRADGQAQLVEQVRREELGQQVRASLGEHPRVAAPGQLCDRGLQVDVLVAGHDDVRVLGQLGAAVRRRRVGGDDDRARVRRGTGEQAAGRVEVEARADNRDRRCRRPAVPQVAPQLARSDRRVAFGPRGRPADEDDVGERAEQREHVPVRGRGQAGRGTAEARGPVRAGHHVGAQARTWRVGVKTGEIVVGQIGLREQLAHVSPSTAARSRRARTP
jgi:hypothetical protein